MLLVLTGSSCAGKSTLAFEVAGRFANLAVHDFDEIGVPAGADRRWRQASTEGWIVRALDYQARGSDVLLSGQPPLGEVLASPSAPQLDGIAVCLIDVSDDVRRQRLEERDPGRWDEPATEAFLGWAVWHRGHAVDPAYRPDVITQDGWEAMRWRRWTDWDRRDRRWCTDVLHTTGQQLATSVVALAGWVERQRDLHRHGVLPLGDSWAGESVG